MWARRIEIGCGVQGAALGPFALGLWLFAMPCTFEMSCTGFTNWQEAGGGLVALWAPPVDVWFTVFAGLSLATAGCSLWHGLGHRILALVLLWAGAVLLVVTWVVEIPPILTTSFFTNLVTPEPIVGIQVAPIQWDVPAAIVASVLALVASIAGTVAARQRVPARV